MNAAIPQFAVMQADFARVFLGFLTNRTNGFPFFFVFYDLFQQDVCRFRILVQVIVQVFFYKITYKTAQGRAVGSHIPGIQNGFGLVCKLRFYQADADGSYNGLPDIGWFKIFFVELFYGTGNRFPENRQVGASLRGVLSVGKGHDAFPGFVGVGDHHFNILSCQMDGRIQRFFGHAFQDQVQQPVFGNVFIPVELHFQAFVQVGIMPHHFLYKFRIDGVIGKQSGIRNEPDQCPVFFICLGVSFFQQNTFGEFAETAFPFPEGFYVEHSGSRINGFQSYPVKAYGLLE